ncbi:hypothetical protein R6V09_04240 [Streptomyces sp. W16]|uniref:hypothetical protein n=1 Tax=Streptomyces sp. W16 TaxID=3076631 RepID=UPI00295C1363|nr:hypothetical protein [Streptomyces sp. W16]MDV9169346.1 hypothetical protein [Streptomyces sp. W16]
MTPRERKLNPEILAEIARHPGGTLAGLWVHADVIVDDRRHRGVTRLLPWALGALLAAAALTRRAEPCADHGASADTETAVQLLTVGLIVGARVVLVSAGRGRGRGPRVRRPAGAAAGPQTSSPPTWRRSRASAG